MPIFLNRKRHEWNNCVAYLYNLLIQSEVVIKNIYFVFDCIGMIQTAIFHIFLVLGFQSKFAYSPVSAWVFSRFSGLGCVRVDDGCSLCVGLVIG